MKKIIELISNPSLILLYLDQKGCIRLNDEKYLKLLYQSKFDKKLEIDNPKTFNEKLQWLKLYDRKDIYTKMVDKYEVKEYVKNIIGEEYIIPTIGVYNKFEEIDFDKLPNQFVIKCTHDSGSTIVCKDKSKLNINKTKNEIERCLNTNFFYAFREWPYKNIKPKILIENYMEDKATKELRDYKFFCFEGKVKFFKIDFNRNINHQANYFDENGILQKFGEVICPPDYRKKLEMPTNLKSMIELSEKLSKNFLFLRVDFYESNGKIYFGELTFYPSAGFGKFEPEEWDKKLGDLINIDKIKDKEQ